VTNAMTLWSLASIGAASYDPTIAVAAKRRSGRIAFTSGAMPSIRLIMLLS